MHRRLIHTTLLTLVEASSNGSRRPTSFMRAHTQQHARSECHTQVAIEEFRRNLPSHSCSVGFFFVSYR